MHKHTPPSLIPQIYIPENFLCKTSTTSMVSTRFVVKPERCQQCIFFTIFDNFLGVNENLGVRGTIGGLTPNPRQIEHCLWLINRDRAARVSMCLRFTGSSKTTVTGMGIYSLVWGKDTTSIYYLWYGVYYTSDLAHQASSTSFFKKRININRHL